MASTNGACLLQRNVSVFIVFQQFFSLCILQHYSESDSSSQEFRLWPHFHFDIGHICLHWNYCV